MHEKKSIFLWLLICLLTGLFGSSCKGKIYEERDECPCLLKIGFENSKNIDCYRIWIFDEEENLLKQEMFTPSEAGELYETTIPRCIFKVYVWGNVGDNTLFSYNGTSSMLKQNRSSSLDRLYFGNAKGSCLKREVLSLQVEMCKQYATVELNISCSAKSSMNVKQLTAHTITNSIGYYLNGNTIEGTGAIYTATPSSLDETEDNIVLSFEYNMARPVSFNGISIELNDGIKDILAVDMGKLLKNGNYDIKKRNLNDIKVNLNLSTGICLISCKEWEETDDVEIVM